MTRRRSPEPSPVIRQGPSLGDGERTVIRPGEEPLLAEEIFRREHDPHRPENYGFATRLHGQLMGNLSDDDFLISMRNRLRMLEQERAAPAFWRWFKGLLFGSPETNMMAGFEVKRLKRLAGETPPDSLPDYANIDLPFDELARLVSTAGSHVNPAAAEPPGRTA